MIITKPHKKGGRYTKKEQEERRLHVFHLHFEEKKSAVEIAKLLIKNRNTIDNDIKYLYQKIGSELNVKNMVTVTKEQILKIEIQKERLLENLDEAENLDQKIKLEKSISEINDKLYTVHSKLISYKGELPSIRIIPKHDEEDDVRQFVRSILLSEDGYNSYGVLSENELICNYIKMKKCDIDDAFNLIRKMRSLGLMFCEKILNRDERTTAMANDSSIRYYLYKFAELRDYLTSDETKEFLNNCQDRDIDNPLEKITT